MGPLLVTDAANTPSKDTAAASQLLATAPIACYALAYVGAVRAATGHAALRAGLPAWVKLTALAGLGSSIISLAIAVYPIAEVTSRAEYSAKICAVVLLANGAGVLIYRSGRGKAGRAE